MPLCALIALLRFFALGWYKKKSNVSIRANNEDTGKTYKGGQFVEYLLPKKMLA